MDNKNKKEETRFLETYDKYSQAIFRYCYYRVFDREKAKDFVQEAYCRTWKYISEGNEIENIRAFIYRTANNLIIDEVRKKKSVSLNQIMDKGFTPSHDPRQQTEDYFVGKEIVNIVKSLDEKYRDVIILKYIEGLSTREIASIIKEKENNVYIRLYRGLKKAKKVFR